jgi:hypothetical protein
MKESQPSLKNRLDASTLEMILVLALISLHDFVLSNALSLPVALQNSSLLHIRALDRAFSGLEFIVPVVVFGVMLSLWLMRRNDWVRTVAIIYLAWVTLRLVAKVALLFSLILARKHAPLPSLLLSDTVILWFVILLLFATWYWIIDRGGPHARREAHGLRPDFYFQQEIISIPGWQQWRPGFWDYLYIAFSSSTQFGTGDSPTLSMRAKILVMLQVLLSILVIVFIASMATGLIH